MFGLEDDNRMDFKRVEC